MIGIICETGTNIPDSMLQRFQIRKIPLRIILDDIEYRDDGIEIKEEELLAYMQHGLPKTSLPFYDDIVHCFEEMIFEGFTEILAINLSGELSGTYNSFQMVAKKIMKQYPNVEIAVFDSLTVSIGTGMVVYKAASLIEENPQIKLNELMDQLKSMYQSKIQVLFVIPSLKFLMAGGRIGKVMGTIGEILQFKPILTISNDGKVHQAGKEMGFNRAIDKIIDLAKQFISNQKVEVMCIYHSGKDPKTIECTKRIQNELSIYDVPQIFTGTISSALLVHAGPGLVGLGILVE